MVVGRAETRDGVATLIGQVFDWTSVRLDKCSIGVWVCNVGTKCATAFAPLTKGVIDCSMCWKAMVNPICITTLATRIGARFVALGGL